MYAIYQYLYPENIIAKKLLQIYKCLVFSTNYSRKIYKQTTIIFSLQNVVIPTQVYFPRTTSLCVYTYTPVYTEMRF